SFFVQAEDGIRDLIVTGVQTCALPISNSTPRSPRAALPAVAPCSRRVCRGTTAGGRRVPAGNAARGERGVEFAARVLRRCVVLQIGRASCRGRVWSSVGGVW